MSNNNASDIQKNSIAKSWYPPSLHSYLMKNVADVKLVRALAEVYRIIRKLIMRRRFSVGSLKIPMIWFCYFLAVQIHYLWNICCNCYI